jgi:hypothetical protein
VDPPAGRAAHAKTKSLWATRCFDFTKPARAAAELQPIVAAALEQAKVGPRPKQEGTDAGKPTDLLDAHQQLATMRARAQPFP